VHVHVVMNKNQRFIERIERIERHQSCTCRHVAAAAIARYHDVLPSMFLSVVMMRFRPHFPASLLSVSFFCSPLACPAGCRPQLRVVDSL
jgi:hypothetical protein